MDRIDKRIIVELFKGNDSLQYLSKILNISPQAVHYRLKNLEKQGIIKGFKIYVNPNLLGYLHSFIVIKGYDNGYEFPFIASKFSCIEGYTIYEVIGKNVVELEENERKILSITRGEKYMEIRINDSIRDNPIDRRIISYIRDDPTVTLNELATKLNLSIRKISSKIKKLYSSGLIKKIPAIDLQKSNILMFSVFSDDKMNEFDDLKILKFSDVNKTLLIGVTENYTSIIKRVRNALEENKKFALSIKYDYYIYEIE
ncbi:putative transcriptional regulator, AsnC family [Sulfolobus islandicus Y.N.15.51]|jgi:DNA-binding Lrp family transcriptional regulator|uniref:Putative transcriptional regulator, AsnC family n=1 Tax=Saccharolobus islandicus (strain Y.N.15.51 / Yellowstone \|nr:winged helix-turn-helix transcriptional regulator [Sulfolobus islandicus]ACP48900.1 putative transcriptional regulator, AsnC family [Sulfolobus islandicus Y.N.15.51]